MRRPARRSWPHGSPETNEEGVVTQHEYDPHGNRIKTTEALGTDVERITRWTYDAYGQALTQTLQNSATPLIRRMSYDAKGNITTLIDEEGATTRYTHNVRGQVVSATNALGHIWRAEYDAAGNRTKVTDPIGNVTTTAFDAQGRVFETKDPLGSTTRISYNAQGKPLKITDAMLGEHRYKYDTSGRLVQQTSPAGLTSLREYDAQGRLAKTTDPAGNVSTYEYVNAVESLFGVLTAVNFPTYREEYRYDRRNRPTAMLQMQGGVTRSSIRVGYDPVGRVISQTTTYGAVSLLRYDALGRSIQHTDPLGGITRQTLDVRDNPISLVDPNGNTHRFEYDKAGRMSREIRPAGGVTTSSYDAVGQLTSRTLPAGNIEGYQYDTAGRLFRVSYTPAGQASPSHSVEATYDAAARLQELSTSTNATSAAMVQRYSSDALGRVIQEQTTYGSGPAAIQATLAYSYNPDGALIGMAYPDGSNTSYSYNKGQLQSATTPAGQSIQWSAYTWGQPTRASYPGVNRSQSYDPLQRPLATSLTPTVEGPALMERTLLHDGTSRVLQRNTEAGNFSYSYDEAGRLTGVTPPVALQGQLPVEGYTYDASGNRTSSAHQPGTWAYNAEHQLLHWGSAANQTSLRYNPNGNLQTQSVGGQTRTHSYDAADRLSEVKDEAGNSAQYSYDPQGRRVRKSAGGKTTWYLYSPQGLVAELNDAGKVEKAYGWEPDQTWGSAPLWQATTSNGQLNNVGTADYHYLHTDHLGTVQMATDSNGQVSWKAQAQAFGKTELDAANRITMNLRLPGQYFDSETGTHYNWMRDYNGSTGRYIQRDPIGLAGGVNPLSYVGANPISYTDPEGLWVNIAGGAVVGGLGNLGYQLWNNGGSLKCVDWGDVGYWAFAGAMAGALVPEGLIAKGGMQTVTRWGPPGSWVMTGNQSARNWLFSGSPRRYAIKDVVTTEVPAGSLAWPAAEGSGLGYQAAAVAKGLIGQRVLIGGATIGGTGAANASTDGDACGCRQ